MWKPATKHCFTVLDYHKMAGSGILSEDDRVELIEGEVVDLTPIGRTRAACVARLTDLFGEGLRRKVIVWAQNPLRLDQYSEPQPDVALLRWRRDFYADSEPGPDDVLLVIEVAETSLLYDRNVKISLYARAGTCEVWLVDLNGESVTIHREPGPQGYRHVAVVQGSHLLNPLAFPDMVLTVDQILKGR